MYDANAQFCCTHHLKMYLFRTVVHICVITLIMSMISLVAFGTPYLKTTDKETIPKLSPGKDWYVYIQAYISDVIALWQSQNLIRSTTCKDTLAHINHLFLSKNPCPSLHIDSEGKVNLDVITGEGISHTQGLQTMPIICGSIFKRYAIISPEEAMYDPLIWEVNVTAHFIINITVVSLQANFRPSCRTLQMLLEQRKHDDMDTFENLGRFCPEYLPKSFYSTTNSVRIYLGPNYIHYDVFYRDSYFNRPIGNVSFMFQIFDNDLTFNPINATAHLWTNNHPSHAYSVTWSEYWSRNTNLSADQKLPFHSNNSLGNNASLFNITSLPVYQVYETKNVIVYTVRIRSNLGSTFAIKEGLLVCTSDEVTLITYEGPAVELTMIDKLLLRLQIWNCGHIWNATNDTEELKGRIGEMMAVLYVNKREHYFFSLGFVKRDICETPKVVLCKKFNIADKPSSIRLDESGTFFYTLDIDAGQRGFVRIIFEDLSFLGYADNLCNHGGIFILYHLSEREIIDVGGICSLHGTNQFKGLYGRRGLTLSRRVLIHVKQYRFLTQIYGKLAFSVDYCFGWVNLLPVLDIALGRYHKKDTLKFDIIKERLKYYPGKTFYYRVYKNHGWYYALGVTRHTDLRCLKLQYVIFDRISPKDVRQPMTLWGTKSIVSINHKETIMPSQITLAFWDINEELKDFDSCLLENLRFLSDNRNDEPYTYIMTSKDDPYTTTSFTSKIGLSMSCLLFSGAFHIQAEDIGDSGECLSEIGAYLYAYEHPIIPKGICGNFPVCASFSTVNLTEIMFFSFQSLSNHPKCCYLEMSVMPKDNRSCIFYASMERLLDPSGLSGSRHEWFRPSNKDFVTDITWRGACIWNIFVIQKIDSVLSSCISILVQMCRVTCKLTLVYRQSPLYQISNSGLREKKLQNERQMCGGETCYLIRYSGSSHMSWNEASARCEGKNGSLVSINSDREWKMLTSSTLVHFGSVQLFYIGYRTEVSDLAV